MRPLFRVHLAITFALIALASGARGGDQRDGPLFPNTAVNGQRDVGGIYVFQAPGNVNNTVLIMKVQPFPGNLSPASLDTKLWFEIKVDHDGDAREDLTFRATFGAPDGSGVQAVTLTRFHAARAGVILAQGLTGNNLAVTGGGQFRLGIQDEPHYFDAGGFGSFVAAGATAFPRPAGTAKNFFGPNGNTFAIVIEVPRTTLRSSASSPNIGVWCRTVLNGVQQDRAARPLINTVAIPPVPRNNLTRGERRNAFNAGLPRNDRRDFRDDMISVLESFYGRPRNTSANPPLTSADGLANFLLPDILTFNTNTAFTTDANDANGFPNGRRLRDDTPDVMLNLLTSGAIVGDNVSDDNGDKITDGTKRPDTTLRPIAFPYIGAANLPLNGPGTGPNP